MTPENFDSFPINSTKLKRRQFVGASLALMALSAAPNLACAQAPQTAEAALPDDQTFDVVVAGATPGGIACAVRAAREGLSVLLVDHSQHLGGILSNGLGVWDTQYEGRRSPIYDETRAGIMAFYRQTYGENSPQYQGARPGASGHTNGRVEPRVFEKFVTDLVAKEPNIRVVTGFYATEARRAGRTVEALRFARTEGATDSFWAKAKVFVDCTYEGDALAAMKLAYLVGRESLDKWNEPHAGHLWMKKIEPRVHDKPEVDLRKFNEDQIKLPQSTGVGDDRVQAYNLRVILSSDPNNQVAVTKPANYDVAALRKLDDSSIVRGLPNDKVCWNRPQLIGLQNAYPEGDWKTRAAITLAHREAAQGLLWYLQNDPGVPADKQREWKRWGLARDEFGDNDHWPRELYVREARRLDGRATFTQHDAMLAEGISRAPIHGDSIAVTEWYMDTHATGTQTVNGSLMEGKMMLHAETVPGQISYQTLLPREVDNVLVPVCASFTPRRVGHGAPGADVDEHRRSRRFRVRAGGENQSRSRADRCGRVAAHFGRQSGDDLVFQRLRSGKRRGVGRGGAVLRHQRRVRGL